jgi:hypothetical protein
MVDMMREAVDQEGHDGPADARGDHEDKNDEKRI